MPGIAEIASAKRSGPASGALAADALLERWFSCLRDQLRELRIFDCHTHLGCADPDGSCFEVDELLGALEIVDGRAVVFSLAEPGSYRAANDRMLEAAGVVDGRLIPFCRVDPRAPIILAHAAIADLAWIWREAAAQPNLFFDTAWWNITDQLALFALIPPGQILFASDTPSGRTVAATSIALRAAMAAGLTPHQITVIAGGQLERLLTGAQPYALGPPPTRPAPAPGPLLERVHTLLVAAAARLTAGSPADEYLELARLACRLPGDHPDASVAASVLELLDRHALHLATDPDRREPRVPGIHLIFVAAAVARTPSLPVPAPGSLNQARSPAGVTGPPASRPGQSAGTSGPTRHDHQRRSLTMPPDEHFDVTIDLQTRYQLGVGFEEDSMPPVLTSATTPPGEEIGPTVRERRLEVKVAVESRSDQWPA
jgi:hypothetical protein